MTSCHSWSHMALLRKVSSNMTTIRRTQCGNQRITARAEGTYPVVEEVAFGGPTGRSRTESIDRERGRRPVCAARPSWDRSALVAPHLVTELEPRFVAQVGRDLLGRLDDREILGVLCGADEQYRAYSAFGILAMLGEVAVSGALDRLEHASAQWWLMPMAQAQLTVARRELVVQHHGHATAERLALRWTSDCPTG